MTFHMWNVVFGALASIAILWVLLLVLLWRIAPERTTATDALRMLPDAVRLARRLCLDRDLPIHVRARLWLLVAYLAFPFDLVPDFVPVIGYADDVIVMIFVLRSVARRAGKQKIADHWPGSDQGLQAMFRLLSL